MQRVVSMTETKTIPLRKAFSYTFGLNKDATNITERTIEGYGTTEAEDRVGESVSLKAVEAAIEQYKGFPVIYADHNPPPVAEAINLSIDRKGLVVKSKFFNNTQASEEAWELVQQGGYRAYSIGGYIEEVETIEKNGKKITQITKLSIAEISLTGAPANPECLFSVIAKSLDAPPIQKGDFEDCVAGIMADPKFKPAQGKTKRQAAEAICASVLECGITSLELEAKSMTDKDKKPTETDPKQTETPELKEEVASLRKELGELTALVKTLKPEEPPPPEPEPDPEKEELAKSLAPYLAKALGLQYSPEPIRTSTQSQPPTTPTEPTESKEPLTVGKMLAQGKPQIVDLEEFRK